MVGKLGKEKIDFPAPTHGPVGNSKELPPYVTHTYSQRNNCQALDSLALREQTRSSEEQKKRTSERAPISGIWAILPIEYESP